MELYDFTILFPVIIGSLSTIVIFALVRVLGGTTAGLFSALFFSVSLPLIYRGTIGWFKSEPLGLFLGILALYFLLSGLNSKNKKIAIVKLIAAGITIPLSISACGGSQFFIIPIGVFFLTLPFVRSDHKFIKWAIPLFTTTAVLVSLSFEKVSSHFIFGLGGASLIIPTIFIIACIFIQSKSNENKKTRNGLLFLASVLIFGTCILIINADTEFLPLPSYRYLNAINPFLTTSVPLVDSVAEHASTTIDQSFLFHSILMIFAGLGIWLIVKNYQIKNSGFKNDMILFSLIFGLIGIYVSSAFVRLEVFASLSLIILSSLGLSILVKEILNNIESKKFKNLIIKFSFLVGIIILLVIPISFPPNDNWITITKIPPTILNGGTVYPVSTNDWLESMEWIKNNTPKDAVVASWWDYGYWISTLGERATIADNSTISTAVIQNLAKMLMSSPEYGWQMLRDMQADYVVVFVSGQRLAVDNEDQALYVLQGGGDESKKQWFIRIAEKEPLTQYLQSDGISGTDYFWNDTLLGKMFPFTPLAYVNFQTNQQSATYQPGFTPVYVKEIKYTSDSDGPLRLVHASPSFDAEKGQPMIGVFIYEVNKDFVPTN